jgi:hypothetical protein
MTSKAHKPKHVTALDILIEWISYDNDCCCPCYPCEKPASCEVLDCHSTGCPYYPCDKTATCEDLIRKKACAEAKKRNKKFKLLC